MTRLSRQDFVGQSGGRKPPPRCAVAMGWPVMNAIWVAQLLIRTPWLVGAADLPKVICIRVTEFSLSLMFLFLK